MNLFNLSEGRLHDLKGVWNCICDAVRPLTAEEIAQRREALKQRLAEKKQHTSQDNAVVSGELSSGNVNWLFLFEFLKMFETV